MMDPLALEQLKKSDTKEHLKKIGFHPHHGFILMLSSLHSENSCGIGEFGDLLKLLPWVKKAGFDFIQLLPITDSGADNSPYNPISTFALNPVFLSLSDLKSVSSNPSLKSAFEKLKNKRRPKNVEYTNVRFEKLNFLREYYNTYKTKIIQQKSFKRFQKNHPWLEDYSLFCALIDHQKSPNWLTWQKPYQKLTAKKKQMLIKNEQDNMLFYQVLQFLCFEQFSKVKKEAEKLSLHLMGDLPFLVSQLSCDAWAYPGLFSKTQTVGSPPDYFTPKGQNWAFPAYEWSYLEKTDYQWWKSRLKVAEDLFHIYRLDHIIGFYRTWNVPLGQTADKGAYYPKDASLWLERGRRFLKILLNASSLLPIGEDLVIPQAILDSLRDLGIPGTRIMPFQRTGAGGLDFVPFELYTVASTTHIASHDTQTLDQWWKNNPKAAKDFALWLEMKPSKKLTPELRKCILKKSHQTSSLFHANLMSEYLALIPSLRHKNINDERINYPGTPSDENWTLRLTPSVEKLLNHSELYKEIQSICR